MPSISIIVALFVIFESMAVGNSDPVHIQPLCIIPSSDADNATSLVLCGTLSSNLFVSVNGSSTGSFVSMSHPWTRRSGNVIINSAKAIYNTLLLSLVPEDGNTHIQVLNAVSYPVGTLFSVACQSESKNASTSNSQLEHCQSKVVAENGTLAIHRVKTVEENGSSLYLFVIVHQQQLAYLCLNGVPGGSGAVRSAHFKISADQSLLVVSSPEEEFNISLGTREDTLTFAIPSPGPTIATTGLFSFLGFTNSSTTPLSPCKINSVTMVSTIEE